MNRIFIGSLVAGMILALPITTVLGAMTKEDIQTLKDASAALQPTNPDLSSSLSKYADEEAAELQSSKGASMDIGQKMDMGNLSGKDDAAKSPEDEKADIKLLRDSAAALKSTNASLSDKLNAQADMEEKMMSK